jgi:hypothetical protein
MSTSVAKEFLPPMPAHNPYYSPSEVSTYSMIDSARPQSSETGLLKRSGQWIAVNFWHSVAHGLGIKSFEEAQDRDEGAGLTGGSELRLMMRKRKGKEKQKQLKRSDRESLVEDARIGSNSRVGEEEEQGGVSETELASDLNSNFVHLNEVQVHSESESSSIDAMGPSDVPRFTMGDKPLLYVRMYNGQLVRKLSTIPSESESSFV